NEVLAVKDLKAPEGVRILNDPNQAVVMVAPPMAEETPAGGAPVAAGTAEPEVLTERKPKEGAAEGEKGGDKKKQVDQAIIGLGNPGREYRDTRHNVGQRGVDGLRRRIHTRFARDGGHSVARTHWRGDALYLIKLGSYMNTSGPAAARLCRRLHLGPADLVIVFDDLDLPLGVIRLPGKGSASGPQRMRPLIRSFRP